MSVEGVEKCVGGVGKGIGECVGRGKESCGGLRKCWEGVEKCVGVWRVFKSVGRGVKN